MQALWMVLASFFFASMAVGIKLASASFGLPELVFYRGVVSVVFMALVLRARGTPLATPVPWMHAWRAAIGVFSLATWFYAIAHLPLATAMTLNYMSGVWVAAFVVGGAMLYGKSTGQGALMATVLAGFAGVVMMLRPTLDQNQLFAGLVGLLSGLGAAMAYLQVTALGKAGEPEGRTVFYFSVGTTLAGLIAVSWDGFTPWQSVSWQAAAWLIPIGVLATLGQWSMTRAYSRGPTLLVANLQYAGIVFASGYSLLLFEDQIPLIGWAGMALIVASGMAATVLRTKVLPNTPAEDH
ncbi:MAG: DMT family transporter [Betaproteobacteria bacterium]|nr:DMT family transporter [Betaproteobacteria bacterium]NCP80762.1 DMT family transporter [Rhodoferax sp.]PIZ22591.1 MAG: EamA family transporter [Comamonadaceae bacterium CG_4_10_14_0_8_um_filter_57_29]PJC16106.1 MAG: EamA family transporter [Comamonadaceae bacterium CG_4_9_14_0_8_um_filter_57_21]